MPSPRYLAPTPEVAMLDPRSASCKQSWYKRRTYLEKVLVLLLLLCFISALIAVAVFASLAVSTSDDDRASRICMTPDCIKTAARILGALDDTIDPCDDFFEYACGTWNRVNPIPDDRPNYNTFRQLDDQLQTVLKVLLETPVQTEDITAVKTTKWLYQSCINMTLLEIRKTKPLQSLLTNLGGWPVLDANWDPTNFDLADLLARLKLHGHSVIINLWVSSDDRLSNVNVIQLDQGPLGLPSRDYFLKGRGEDRALSSYRQLAVRTAMALGASSENAQRDVNDMIEFEIQLANITIPEEQRRDNEANYHRFNVKELYSNLTDKFNWLKYIRKVFSNVSINIEEDEPIVVYAPQYMKQVFRITESVSKRTLNNYILWHVVMNRASNLHQEFLDMRRDFNKVMMGTEQERARWLTCTTYVNENFGMVVGRMYIEKHFDERAKSNAVAMIDNIREAFSELLRDIVWMSDATKIVAREKADAVREKIGYPDYIKNDTALNLEVEGINLSPTKYFENIFNMLHISVRNNVKVLRQPVDRDKWSSGPTVVNAFYSPAKNQIMFPAAILHPPFYHENYPMYLNFGGIAMIIGHELTHGFDDKGRQYDKEGNMKEWWSATDVEKFKEKAQCIIEQYSNYSIPEASLNLNGKQTQGENIADNGGLKQAFKAYKLWTNKHGPEDVLPGLQLNPNQLFFLSFAQMWCGTSRPEYSTHSIRTGKHSPGKIRVIGSLSNSVDFAEAFNCAPGSRLNPVNKCSVW